MLILDLGEQGTFYQPEEGKGVVNVTNIKSFIHALAAKSLERKQWGS